MQEFDYNSALQYFLEHSTNGVLKRIFSRGESVYTRERLKEELSKIGRVKQAIHEQPSQPNEPQLIDYYALPDEVKVLIDERNGHRKRRNFHFTLMQHGKNDGERRDHLEAVLESDKLLDEAQEKVDYFYRYGQLPAEKEKEKVELMDVQDLMKRKMTLRKNISKAKKKDDKNKENQWREELLLVENKLNHAIQN